MKKFLALIIVLAVCLSCCTVMSFAELNTDFIVCIDFLQTRAEPCTAQATIFDQPIESLDALTAKNGDTVYLEDDTAKYLFFEGWYATELEYVDETASIGCRVDGGEIVWSSEPDPALTAAVTGGENNLRAYVNLLIYQGTHYVEVFAKIVDEADPVPVFDFEYESEFGEIPPATPTPEPTEVPTEAPATEVPAATDEPVATDAPQAATDAPKATEAPEKAEKKNNNAPLFIGIGAAVVVIGVVALIIAKKKKG